MKSITDFTLRFWVGCQQRSTQEPGPDHTEHRLDLQLILCCWEPLAERVLYVKVICSGMCACATQCQLSIKRSGRLCFPLQLLNFTEGKGELLPSLTRSELWKATRSHKLRESPWLKWELSALMMVQENSSWIRLSHPELQSVSVHSPDFI